MHKRFVTTGGRVNLVPLAKQFYREGYVESPGHTNPKFFEIHHDKELRREFYALLAVILNNIFGRVNGKREERPPYGLVERLESDRDPTEYRTVTSLFNGNPFLNLGRYMMDTLYQGIDEELEFLEDLLQDKLSTNPIKTTYARFKKMYVTDKDPEYLDGLKDMTLRPGVNTATDAMAGILEVIPQVYERDYPKKPEASKLVEIAQNSYPLIAELAMGHERFIVPALWAVREIRELFTPLDPKYFKLKNINGNLQLTLPETTELTEKIKQISGNGSAPGDSKDPTLGCPAMVDFDGGSAVKKLWKWNIEVAQTIYQHLYPTTK